MYPKVNKHIHIGFIAFFKCSCSKMIKSLCRAIESNIMWFFGDKRVSLHLICCLYMKQSLSISVGCI